MRPGAILDPEFEAINDRVVEDASERADGVRPTSWMVEHLKRRRWPLAVMLTFVIVAMVYSFCWNPIVHHSHDWVIPGDIWSTFRAAHWVGWGDLGGIYGTDTQLVTFPGIAVLLAPVAMVSGVLGLGESHAPIFNSQPSSWLLLGPVILLLGSTCLLALDSMAEELGVAWPRRIALSCLEAVIIFQVIALWGHPEDMLALSFALYALLALFRGRWSLSGWLWGAAIVTQPLVLLLFPLAFARTPTPQRVRLCLYGALPSLLLLSAPLADAVAPDFKRPSASGECQISRSCDTMDRSVTRLVTDHCWRRTRSNDCSAHSGPSRLFGLPKAAIESRPSLVVCTGTESPLLLRISDGCLLPGTSSGTDDFGCCRLCKSKTASRDIHDRPSSDHIRLPWLIGVGILDPDGGFLGHRIGLCVAGSQGSGSLRQFLAYRSCCD